MYTFSNMSATSQKKDFLFLMRGADWDKGISPSEAQEGIIAMMAWIDDLKAKGIVLAGQPLDFAGGVVSSKDGLVTDGPYVESKEAVGGYLITRADSFEAAMEAARGCPVLKYGLVIEVRPIIGQCHIADEFGLEMASATS